MFAEKWKGVVKRSARDLNVSLEFLERFLGIFDAATLGAYALYVEMCCCDGCGSVHHKNDGKGDERKCLEMGSVGRFVERFCADIEKVF